MSLPKIPDINPKIDLTREDSINILIASVGLEEMALAHILNAEGEKIQYILGTLDGNKPKDVTVCDVMNVNESVNKTLRNVVATEMLLLFKLEDAIGLGGSEECRKNLTIKKIWNDGNNAHNTRPASVEITLLRDGEKIDTATLTAVGNWTHTFRCLPVGNGSKLYEYTIDETIVPAGYRKTVSGYNVTNILEEITVSGTKTWHDNHNVANKRPATITINILQNGVLADSLELAAPPAGEDIVKFEFANIPFADDDGKPFVYTVTENPVIGYTTTVNGFNITNTLITGGFSFTKTSTATGYSLPGAVFDVRQNGSLIATSQSDALGRVSFEGLLPGAYQMAETVPPVGYMDNTAIYTVVVNSYGSVTIDGLPPALFGVKNTPKRDDIILRRATSIIPAYMAAPNTWPLHGAIESDLYILDKILITLPGPAVLVKWAYGIQDVYYFRSGGGTDIMATYQDGFSASLNSDYTVYALYGDGTDAVASITIDRLRDGTAEMPYLLIDFSTADALNPSVPGIDQFTLYYMQGNGAKLAQHYEMYENIDMTGKAWEPLGIVGESSPYPIIEGFTGGLYGNGHDIANLSIIDAGQFSGLFAAVTDGAEIQELGLSNCNIEGNGYPAGFISWLIVNSGSSVLLKGLRFQGSITALSGTYCGGIVSYSSVSGSLTVDACSAYGIIQSNATNTAGIISYCYSRDSGISMVTNCVNAATINAGNYGGGILSLVTIAIGITVVSSCYNKGEISSIVYAAGIVGWENSVISGNLTIENCYNSGKIITIGPGLIRAGGVNGYMSANSRVYNCYNTGDIVSSAYITNAIGGVAGMYGNVQNCAAACELVSTITASAARISPVAVTGGSPVLSGNRAFDKMRVLIGGVQKAPLDTGSSRTDGISVTAAELKTQALYENTLGWDFTSVWSFGNGAYTLPILRGIPANLQPIVLPPHLA